MIERDEFWKHVHAALDERRDPLDDERVQRALEDEPELFAALERMSARVAELATARPRGRRKRAASIALLAASLAGVLGIALWSQHEPARDVAAPSAPRAIASAPAPIPQRSCVLSFTAEVVHETPTSRSVTVFDGRTTRRSSTTFSEVEPGHSGPGFVAVVESFAVSR